MSDLVWLEQILSAASGESSQNSFGDLLPRFPSQELQFNTTGLSGRDTLIQAFYFYEDILTCAESQGFIFDADTKILDFGVCWGRIARFFLNKVPLKNIYGLDVEPKFVEMVQDLFRSKNFSVTSVLPPTNYPNNNFSFVTAYSVFSHLSESASSVWIEEFARIIKPGGLLALTTRHETFFDFLQGLQRKRFGLFRRKGYLKALAELFPNMHKARKDYRNGQFVFATSRGVSGGGSMNETFYGEAFIPKQYVQTHYCHYFDLVDSKFDSSRYDQQLFILQRNKCSLDVCQLKHVTSCAAEFSVSPLIHSEDFIFKFLIENPSFKSTQAAIRYYFSTGRESAIKLHMLLNFLEIDI